MDVQFGGTVGGSTVKGDERAAVLIVRNLDVAPPDPAGLVCPRQRLEGCLLSREAGRHMRRGGVHRRAVAPFIVGEQPARDAFSVALQHLGDPLDVDQVHPEADDHSAARPSAGGSMQRPAYCTRLEDR